ncbi:MAG: T9SS type A sorting domain-containing protein [Saprospiraceae bacterium]|nr:T9SS type A sorting domain-containing protein [Candidatus Brachybacter algidus]
MTIPADWQNKKVVYELFSANGQVAKKMETTGSSQTETMNVSNLNRGLYIVKVTCEGKTAQQKIVKQ